MTGPAALPRHDQVAELTRGLWLPLAPIADGVRVRVGNREAFMIGYVRDGWSIDTTLTPALLKAMELHPDRYLEEALPEPVGSGSFDLAYTRHGRDFAYGSQRPPNRPGPISVWHLWLT